MLYYFHELFEKIRNLDCLKFVELFFLKQILKTIHNIKVVVTKKSRIYFIDNVKFHFDEVQGLGTFIEVEAINTNGNIATCNLQQQCNEYINFFNICHTNFVQQSYSDLLLAKG